MRPQKSKGLILEKAWEGKIIFSQLLWNLTYSKKDICKDEREARDVLASLYIDRTHHAQFNQRDLLLISWSPCALGSGHDMQLIIQF